MPMTSSVRRLPSLIWLAFTILGTGTVVARSASAPPSLAAPVGVVTQQGQEQSLDAVIVESANGLLLEYAKLSPVKQTLLAPFAVEVARLRRAALERLIRRDPQHALLLSLSPGQRQGLPKHVVGLLETRIHAVGDLTQAVAEDLPEGKQPPPSHTSWTARIKQTTREAFVYGVRLGHQTKYGTPLHGIAIGGVMAVDESPLYLYDDFEKWTLGFGPNDIVATSGGFPILCQSLEAFDGLRKDLLDRLLRFGPYSLSEVPPSSPHPWTIGPKRVLVIKADYGDRPGALYTDDQIASVFVETGDFYEENSQGQTSLLGPTVLPELLHLPSTAAQYAMMGLDLGHDAIRDDAAAAARAYDATVGGTGMFDPAYFDRFLVLTPQVLTYPVGRGDLGGKGIVISGERLVFPTLAHELGHTYGFTHSNFWRVGFDGDPIGPGESLEYGDVWDMMGSPFFDDTDREPRRRHFNGFFKWFAGWLTPASVADATAGGTFRLYRHDAADAGGLRAIRIDADAEKTYWLDIRRQFPWNSSMANGIEVRRVTTDPSSTRRYGQVHLLDMDPMNGASLVHSLTPFGPMFVFEDAGNGLRVWLTGVGVDEVGAYADVRIDRRAP